MVTPSLRLGLRRLGVQALKETHEFQQEAPGLVQSVLLKKNERDHRLRISFLKCFLMYIYICIYHICIYLVNVIKRVSDIVYDSDHFSTTNTPL